MKDSPFTSGSALPPAFSLGDYRLRAMRPGDAREWSSYLSNIEVTRNTSWSAVDFDTIETLIKKIIGDYSTRTSCRWAIARVEDDLLVGTCGFSWWSHADLNAELVYDLSPAYWRRGIMRRAVDTVVHWAFDVAGLNRVQAVVMTTNQPSIALLEKCGFVREGLLRQYRMARSTPADFFMYSLLARSPSSLNT